VRRVMMRNEVGAEAEVKADRVDGTIVHCLQDEEMEMMADVVEVSRGLHLRARFMIRTNGNESASGIEGGGMIVRVEIDLALVGDVIDRSLELRREWTRSVWLAAVRPVNAYSF